MLRMKFNMECENSPLIDVLAGGGGGGHFHWRPYQMLERERKTREKGIQIRGGRGMHGSRKGCQNRE